MPAYGRIENPQPQPGARRGISLRDERRRDSMTGVRECLVRDDAEGRRDLAATQLTSATQRELAPYFGRTHPDSIRNLTRRIDAQLKTSRTLKKDVKQIRLALQKTVNRV